MTPEQAKRAYEAMSPETKDQFHEHLKSIFRAAFAVETALTKAGQEMAGDVEDWLREETQ